MLGLHRFGMGIEVRVRVLLFLFPVEDFYGFRVRPRVLRALPFLLLSLVFLSFLLGINLFGDLGLGFLFDSVHLIYLILFFLFYCTESFSSLPRHELGLGFFSPFLSLFPFFPFGFDSLLVLGLNRFGMGIEVRVRV